MWSLKHIFIYFVSKKNKFHEQSYRWHEIWPVFSISVDSKTMSPAFLQVPLWRWTRIHHSVLSLSSCGSCACRLIKHLLFWSWGKNLEYFNPKVSMCSLIPSQVLPFPSQVVYNRVGKCGSRTVVLLLRILSEKHGFNLVTSDIHNKTRLTKNEQVSCLWPWLNCTLLQFIGVISGCLTGHPSNPDGCIPDLQLHTVYLSACGRKFKLSVLVVVFKPGSFREGILLLDQRTVCTHHCLFS